MRLARAGCVRIGENVGRGTAFGPARKCEKPLVHLRLAADGLVAVGRIERDPAVARDRNPHRIIGVTGRLQFLPVEPDAFTDLLGRSELIQQQVVAATSAKRNRVCTRGREPDRRVWPLVRRRLDHDVVEPPEAAAMRKRLVGRKRAAEHCQNFLETRFGLFGSHCKACKLVVAIALADAEIEPSGREHVERRNLLGEKNWIMPGQHEHRRAQPSRVVRAAMKVSIVRIADI